MHYAAVLWNCVVIFRFYANFMGNHKTETLKTKWNCVASHFTQKSLNAKPNKSSAGVHLAEPEAGEFVSDAYSFFSFLFYVLFWLCVWLAFSINADSKCWNDHDHIFVCNPFKSARFPFYKREKTIHISLHGFLLLLIWLNYGQTWNWIAPFEKQPKFTLFDCNSNKYMCRFGSLDLCWIAMSAATQWAHFSTSNSHQKDHFFYGNPFRCSVITIRYTQGIWQKSPHNWYDPMDDWWVGINWLQTCRLCINQWHVQHLIDFIIELLEKPRKSIASKTVESRIMIFSLFDVVCRRQFSFSMMYLITGI